MSTALQPLAVILQPLLLSLLLHPGTEARVGPRERKAAPQEDESKEGSLENPWSGEKMSGQEMANLFLNQSRLQYDNETHGAVAGKEPLQEVAFKTLKNFDPDKNRTVSKDGVDGEIDTGISENPLGGNITEKSGSKEDKEIIFKTLHKFTPPSSTPSSEQQAPEENEKLDMIEKHRNMSLEENITGIKQDQNITIDSPSYDDSATLLKKVLELQNKEEDETVGDDIKNEPAANVENNIVTDIVAEVEEGPVKLEEMEDKSEIPSEFLPKLEEQQLLSPEVNVTTKGEEENSSEEDSNEGGGVEGGEDIQITNGIEAQMDVRKEDPAEMDGREKDSESSDNFKKEIEFMTNKQFEGNTETTTGIQAKLDGRKEELAEMDGRKEDPEIMENFKKEIEFMTNKHFEGNAEKILKQQREEVIKHFAIPPHDDPPSQMTKAAPINVKQLDTDIIQESYKEMDVKVLSHFQGYETVVLPPLHLACVTTTVPDTFPHRDDRGFDSQFGLASPQFHTLSTYLAGANRETSALPHTDPHILSVTPLSNNSVTRAHCVWLSSFSRLVPPEMDRHLGFLAIPQPTDPEVEIFATGETVKYTSSFSGFANDWIYRTEAKKLMDAIIESGSGHLVDFTSYCLTVAEREPGPRRHTVAFMQKKGLNWI